MHAAACGIVLGLVYAFFGAKLEKSTAFLAGFLVGAIGTVFILEATGAQNQVANVVYVSIVLAAGLFLALISFCVATLRKLIFGAALAALFMSFVIYLGEWIYELMRVLTGFDDKVLGSWWGTIL